jgi:hypothetical protein
MQANPLNKENGILVAASVLETYSNGGQNEIANRIHIGDGVPGVVYRSALEGSSPEGRAKVEAGSRGIIVEARQCRRLDVSTRDKNSSGRTAAYPSRKAVRSGE